MEDKVWIDFDDGTEPEEHRPMPEGRYEGVVRHIRDPLPEDWPPQHLRKEGVVWYWDWEPGQHLPVNSATEVILRVRRVGDLLA